MRMIDTNIGTGSIERETPKAYLVRIANGVSALTDRMVWIPKSQVEWRSEGNLAETMFLPEWLATKIL